MKFYRKLPHFLLFQLGSSPGKQSVLDVVFRVRLALHHGSNRMGMMGTKDCGPQCLLGSSFPRIQPSIPCPAVGRVLCVLCMVAPRNLPHGLLPSLGGSRMSPGDLSPQSNQCENLMEKQPVWQTPHGRKRLIMVPTGPH